MFINFRTAGLLLACLVSPHFCWAQAQTHTITTPGGVSAFSVDGGPANNPTISLSAGVTNIFNITTSGSHPVVITTAPPPSLNQYSGASPQNINSGTISLKTPSSGFPTKLYYVCSIHRFFGEIDLSAVVGPKPPPNLIIGLQVGTNIVMKSLGTNTTWTLIPEFSSNLLLAAWTTVPGYSNNFNNGTNTTVFNRLDPICGPSVFLRLRQQQN